MSDLLLVAASGLQSPVLISPSGRLGAVHTQGDPV